MTLHSFLEPICATSSFFLDFSAHFTPKILFRFANPRVDGHISKTIYVSILQFGTEMRLLITFRTSLTPPISSKRFGSWNVFSATHFGLRLSPLSDKFIPPRFLREPHGSATESRRWLKTQRCNFIWWFAFSLPIQRFKPRQNRPNGSDTRTFFPAARLDLVLSPLQCSSHLAHYAMPRESAAASRQRLGIQRCNFTWGFVFP